MGAGGKIRIFKWWCRGWKSDIHLNLDTQQVNFFNGHKQSGWHGHCEYSWVPGSEGTWIITFNAKGDEKKMKTHVLHQDSSQNETFHTHWGEAKQNGADVVMWPQP